MNIPTFTPEQQKENLRLAVADLRANPIKATDSMRDKAGGRCCLCVMAETAERICGLLENELSHDSALPTYHLAHVFGLHNIALEENTGFNFTVGGWSATAWNDGSYPNTPEKTHGEIADMIEEEFLKNNVE